MSSVIESVRERIRARMAGKSPILGENIFSGQFLSGQLLNGPIAESVRARLRTGRGWQIGGLLRGLGSTPGSTQTLNQPQTIQSVPIKPPVPEQKKQSVTFALRS